MMSAIQSKICRAERSRSTEVYIQYIQNRTFVPNFKFFMKSGCLIKKSYLQKIHMFAKKLYLHAEIGISP